MNEKRFTVTAFGRSYTVLGGPQTTLEIAWYSQKPFFLPGTVVEITDEDGNKETFVA